MDSDRCRPDPELLLKQVEAQERSSKRGRLKIFLGYSSGVGKSFTMFDEGRRRSERGEDVIVGALQPTVPPDVRPIVAKLGIIPPRDVGGTTAMDVDAIVRRRPQVCLVDGLAWDNPAGSRNAHRWQDVEELLAAGISVIGSINLQYVADYRAQVERITGDPVDETVPLGFIQSADEVVIVDAPAAEALRQSGDGEETPAMADRREQELRALRELALLVVADVVDRQLGAYLQRQGIVPLWGTQERILVCMTPRSVASEMIASGRRNADRFQGELYVVYVEQPNLSPEDRKTVERNLEVAREARATVGMLKGDDAVRAILKYAVEHGITQIFVGHSQRRGWWSQVWGSPIDRLIRLVGGIDVQVFPH